MSISGGISEVVLTKRRESFRSWMNLWKAQPSSLTATTTTLVRENLAISISLGKLIVMIGS